MSQEGSFEAIKIKAVAIQRWQIAVRTSRWRSRNIGRNPQTASLFLVYTKQQIIVFKTIYPHVFFVHHVAFHSLSSLSFKLYLLYSLFDILKIYKCHSFHILLNSLLLFSSCASWYPLYIFDSFFSSFVMFL